MKEIGRVGMLAAGNLLLAGAGNALDKINQILHVILTLGQVGVATITILYVYRKMRAIRKPKAK